jgi:hypothetical protein
MTYLIKSNLLRQSTKSAFIRLDSEKQFKINQANLGKDWYWYNKSFTYQINDYGYRMNKNLHEINFDNYIAFFGCSYTMGVGLPLEDTFSYKIAQQVNMDYVNAAIPGSNVDFAFYNFTKLVSTAPSLPKIVVINWPDIARTMYWYKDNITEFHPDTDSASPGEALRFWTNSYKAYLLEPSNIINRFKYIRQNIVALCRLAGIKLFEFTTEQRYIDNAKLDICCVPWLLEWPIKLQGRALLEFQNQNFARDIAPNNFRILDFLKLSSGAIGWAHPGIAYQDQVVDKFFATLTI